MSWRLVDEEPSESLLQNIGRQSARTVANIATRGIGTFGDIAEMIHEHGSTPDYEAITGQKHKPYKETVLGKILPTTETHRKGLEEISGGYLKPQNKVEAFTDEIVDDLTLLTNPSQLIKKGIQQGAKYVTKQLAKSTGANLAGETVGDVTGSQEAKSWTKAGSLFLLSLLDSKKAMKQISELYGEAEKNLPTSATTDATKLNANLNKLKNQITVGRPEQNLAPSEKFVIDQIEKVEKLSQNGQIPVNQAWAQKRSLNEELTKLYDVAPTKQAQQRARKLAKQVNGFLSEAIEGYGKTNKSFYKPYKEADEAFGTMAKSNVISRWVEKNVKQSPLTHGLMHLIGGTMGTAAGVLVAPYQAGKLAYRIFKSPTLRNMYSKTLKSAAKEDAVLFNKYVKELDDAIQKEEGEEYWQFVD